MLTKCFTLLKVGHETFFLQDLDPHPDRGAYPSNLVSPSTPPPACFSLFSLVNCRSFSLHSFRAPCAPRFISKGDPPHPPPPSTFLLLPSHQFCAHPTLHWFFSSLQGQKNLLSEGKQSGFDRVWGFFCCSYNSFSANSMTYEVR